VDADIHATLEDSTCNAGPSVETVQNISSSPKKDVLPKRILHSLKNIHHVLKYTTEEEDFLKKGMTKCGFRQWTAILRDADFQFQFSGLLFSNATCQEVSNPHPSSALSPAFNSHLEACCLSFMCQGLASLMRCTYSCAQEHL